MAILFCDTHTPHVQIQALGLYHMGPGEEDSCPEQSAWQVLACRLAHTWGGSTFGSAFSVMLDTCVWNPLQPQGVTLLTSCFFLCLIVRTSSPRLLCLALPVLKAYYCWGRGSHHHTVSHPKCVTKCEFRNICLIKFIFCFFLFQFMPV